MQSCITKHSKKDTGQDSNNLAIIFMSVYVAAGADVRTSVLSSHALKRTLHPQVRADKRLDGCKMVRSKKEVSVYATDDEKRESEQLALHIIYSLNTQSEFF